MGKRMTERVRIHGGLLAKNTALNFSGSVVPVGVALVTTPFIIRGLGMDRFGVLSLAWVFLWYSSYFDLGLTRATTKFVAEASGRNETQKIPAVVCTSLAIEILLGFIAALALGLATPFLVLRVLHIPGALVGEAKIAFYLMGASIPFFLNSNILSALLAASQRFDLVNAVKVPSNSLVFLLPALGVLLGYKLPGIVLLLFLSRVATTLVYLAICSAVFPGLLTKHFADWSTIVPVLIFGGWVTVCNVLIPILIYVDRFVIGAVLSMAAVAYYSVPYEMASRLQVIPGSLGGVLFPAFSTMVTQDRERLARLFARSLRNIFLLMGPVTLVLAVFARDILRLWLGNGFAMHGTLPLQVLALGLLLNAIGYVPGNLLDGIGRPDLRARIYLSYALPYILLLWFFVHKLGIVGAALVWSLRTFVELALYLVVVAKLLHLSPQALARNGLLKAIAAYGALAGSVVLLKGVLRGEILVQGAASAVAMAVFSLVTWRFVLDTTDRHALLRILNRSSSA